MNIYCYIIQNFKWYGIMYTVKIQQNLGHIWYTRTIITYEYEEVLPDIQKVWMEWQFLFIRSVATHKWQNFYSGWRIQIVFIFCVAKKIMVF
jgi:hypothetical protein